MNSTISFDTITARISDHNPIIHHDVLFWNIMMRGRMRLRDGAVTYNNGFGIEESEKQYQTRLVKIAHAIAVIVAKNPSIETIGLCEGPIESLHLNVFIDTLKSFKCMQRFFKDKTFYKPNMEKQPHWGLLMFTDSSYVVSEVKSEKLESKLVNRLQLWQLTKDQQHKYFALAHFPFGNDEHVVEGNLLSQSANSYRSLINDFLRHYANDNFVFCADFNFNPYLINQWADRKLDHVPHNNSILITEEKNREKLIKTVTVDGILLSIKEKQKLYHFLQPGIQLFNKMKNEYRFFKTYVEKFLEERREDDFSLQEEHDKRYGLVRC